MKKKGRPKGNRLTIIGLPKKVDSKKPTPVVKKSELDKSKCKYVHKKWMIPSINILQMTKAVREKSFEVLTFDELQKFCLNALSNDSTFR